MAAGKRTNLASLSGSVGVNSPVDQAGRAPTSPPQTARLSELTANPRNPRDDLGDLEGLSSIVDMQLQPVTVVTKAAYLKVFPQDTITTRYVVINGCRRLAAAHKFGRTDLAIVVNDEVARDELTLISAAIIENVDRRGFDVIEEAKAVATLVKACGRSDIAAARLHRDPTWVSHRLALLKLEPELQAALRRGELAIREARVLARVPKWEQVERWRAAMEREDSKDAGGKADKPAPRSPSPARVVTAALAKFEREPQLLARALQDALGVQGTATLLGLLSDTKISAD